jgi:L-asparaginase
VGAAVLPNIALLLGPGTLNRRGRVVQHNNGYREGMVAADTLLPHKAAMLLSLALTRTREVSDIQRMFDEY